MACVLGKKFFFILSSSLSLPHSLFHPPPYLSCPLFAFVSFLFYVDHFFDPPFLCATRNVSPVVPRIMCLAGSRANYCTNMHMLPRCDTMPRHSHTGGDDLLNMGHGSTPAATPGPVPRTIPGPGLMGGNSQVSVIVFATVEFFLVHARLYFLVCVRGSQTYSHYVLYYLARCALGKAV